MTLLAKFGLLPDTHLVPDVLDHHLNVVFCGTALGQQSAMRRAYYANPGNLFWRALHETGFTPERFQPEDYPNLQALGIGLTDLCKIAFGNDAELPENAFDVAGLREKILRYQPGILAFTSKTGASSYLGKATGEIAYGFQPQRTGATRLFVLTSPSGHARRYWRQDIWQELSDAVQALSPAS